MSHEHAMVLSGGGATGAYEIGVMKALFEGRCAHTGKTALDPGIYTGTSVGAFNAAYMASQQESEKSSAVLGRLEEIWRETIAETPGSCGNGAFRLRADPLPYLDLRCLSRNPVKPFTQLAGDGAFLTAEAWQRLVHLVRPDGPLLERLLEVPDISAFIDTSPMDDLVRRHVDVERLRRSKKQLSVVASDWKRARPRVFSKQQILALGYKAVLASASIPAVFPPVELEGDTYVDGGVLMNTPLQPAIHVWKESPARGELSLHVIYLDAELADVPIGKYPSTFGTTNRLVQVVLGRNINSDVEYAAKVNERVRQAAAAGQSKTAGKTRTAAKRKTAAKSKTTKARTPSKTDKAASEKHLLSVHRYRPRTDLGGVLGLLDFRSERIDRLIRKGYDDTIGHDCGAEGCVLA